MFTFVTAVAIIGLLALNWRAQVQAQQKLDALAALGAERAVAVTATPTPTPVPAPVAPPPRELQKIALPPYVIEAPDQLAIEVAVKDPKTGKTSTLPTQPISGPFQVRPDGTVGLGAWGIGRAHRAHARRGGSGRSQPHRKARGKRARGEPRRCACLQQQSLLRHFWLRHQRSDRLAVTLYRGGQCFGRDRERPAGVGSKLLIHITRPGKNGGMAQVLPIDWEGITQHGVTHTNYQLLPGDRLFVTPAPVIDPTLY